jgi:hypothetical protein
MTIDANAYPLSWPAGWPRARTRERAKFHRVESSTRFAGTEHAYEAKQSKQLSTADGVERVLRSLTAMGIAEWNVIVSTNIRPRLDGMPRSSGGAPDDPGVAVYWSRKGRTECIAVDRYDRVADNLAAIAASLDALRAIERHGGAQILERAFSGFTALPAPEQPWQVLGLTTSKPTREQVMQAWRALISKHHTDRPGGDQDLAARINRARDQLLDGMQP